MPEGRERKGGVGRAFMAACFGVPYTFVFHDHPFTSRDKGAGGHKGPHTAPCRPCPYGHMLRTKFECKRAVSTYIVLGTVVGMDEVSNTPALKGGACVWTPPQLCIPLEACSFGFSVRHIRGN